MAIGLHVEPFDLAVRRLSRKTPIGFKLRTRGWSRVPLALRERAMFSAGVESIRVLQSMQNKLLEWAELAREKAGKPRAFMDRSKFIAEMRAMLGAKDGDTRRLTDITSSRRLEVIYDFQLDDAMGYGRWKIDQDPDVINAFPAYEFTRIEARKVPRESVDPGHWHRRFAQAAREVGDAKALAVLRGTGRMIALKNSPLWQRLSIFGRPWPPFDWGSGMGLIDIDRDEAEELGLVKPGEKLTGGEEDYNAGLEASLKTVDEAFRAKLKKWFGDQIQLDGDKIQWRGGKTPKHIKRADEPILIPDPPVQSGEEWPDRLEDLEPVSGLGGSTGAHLYRDPKTGHRYVRKEGASPEHIVEEYYAERLYRAAGVLVPDSKLYMRGARPVKLTRFVEGRRLQDVLHQAPDAERRAILGRVQEGFAADVFVANWDVAGLSYDNIIVDQAGRPWRVDCGGALRFRAQGAPKTLSIYPHEIWTLRDAGINAQTAELFHELDIYTIARQIRRIPDAVLDQVDLPRDLRRLLRKRLDEMRHVADKALEFEVDGWRKTYTEGLCRHIVGLRAAGVHLRLPSRLRVEGVDVYDEHGRKWDDLRSSEGRRSILYDFAEYLKSQGLEYEPIFDFHTDQSASSWDIYALAYKFFLTQQLKLPKDRIFWRPKIVAPAMAYEQFLQQYRGGFESLIAYHALIQELLAKTRFPGNDRDRRLLRIVRCVTANALRHAPYGKPIWYERAVYESGSLFVARPLGKYKTLQAVPHSRVLGIYFLERSPGYGATCFYNDLENEAIFVAPGLPAHKAKGIPKPTQDSRGWGLSAPEGH